MNFGGAPRQREFHFIPVPAVSTAGSPPLSDFTIYDHDHDYHEEHDGYEISKEEFSGEKVKEGFLAAGF